MLHFLLLVFALFSPSRAVGLAAPRRALLAPHRADTTAHRSKRFFEVYLCMTLI